MAVINNKAPITASPYNYDAVYAEDFFNHLKNIADDRSFAPSIKPIPLDEPRIKVNLNQRFIDIENSEYSSFLAMREDQRATTVYFEVDRYFEDVDLNNCTCVVQYMNMGAPEGKAKLRMYPITLKDTESLEKMGKMILAWSLGNEATEYSGNLLFSLIFYSINDAGTAFKYALHTIPTQGLILHGMVYTDDQKKEQDDYMKVQEDNYITLMQAITNKNVYWNDL